MATADQYAQWIVANEDKKGTPEFETVAQAYKEAKAAEASELAAKTAPVKPEDLSKYKDSGISTFLASAINSATFGLPEYLNKKFTPATYAEGEKYREANPMAATAGEYAGYVIPTGAGAIKGAQLGAKLLPAATRGAEKLMTKSVPGAVGNYPTIGPAARELLNFVTQKAGATAGGIVGAQTAASIPGIVAGNPAQAVTGAEVINNLPYVPSLPGPAQHAVPFIAGEAARKSQELQERIKEMIKYEAAKRAMGQ